MSTETTTPALDLDAIEHRVNAADGAPWRVVEEHGRDIADEAYSRLTIQTAERYGESREVAEMVDPEHDWASKLSEENAAFLAHARQDVPALVAEVRRLRAELETVTSQRDAHQAIADELRDDLRAADESNGFLQQHIADIRSGAF